MPLIVGKIVVEEKPSEPVSLAPQQSKPTQQIPNTKLFINNLVVKGSSKSSSQQPQNSKLSINKLVVKESPKTKMLSSFFLVNKDSEYLADNTKLNKE